MVSRPLRINARISRINLSDLGHISVTALIRYRPCFPADYADYSVRYPGPPVSTYPLINKSTLQKAIIVAGYRRAWLHTA